MGLSLAGVDGRWLAGGWVLGGIVRRGGGPRGGGLHLLLLGLGLGTAAEGVL